MTENFNFKDNYNIDDLLEIMKILRAPGGCPWDMAQTHASIKKDFIEETYEVIEAIDKESPDMMKEELGDVLMQVVFHSQIETEKGNFNFDDVCDGICKKLILRHPHVFGSVEADTVDKVLTNWDDIKRKEKNQKTAADAMNAVPKELPALMRAEKLEGKAFKAGYGSKERDERLKCLKESLDKVYSNPDDINPEKIGRLLLAVCGLAKSEDIDAEEALRDVSDEYIKEFSEFEKNSNKE
jgi:tetrapyrrole methylase family protein/MazG family protein